MDLDKVGVGVASRVVVRRSIAIPDTTPIRGGDVLTNSGVSSVVSLLTLVELTGLLGGHPEVRCAREHVSSVDTATSSDHNIHRTFNAMFSTLAAQI